MFMNLAYAPLILSTHNRHPRCPNSHHQTANPAPKPNTRTPTMPPTMLSMMSCVVGALVVVGMSVVVLVVCVVVVAAVVAVVVAVVVLTTTQLKNSQQWRLSCTSAIQEWPGLPRWETSMQLLMST